MSGLWLEAEPLLLASKSAIRAEILRGAGLPVETRPADIDERAVEADLPENRSDPAAVATALAAAKAVAVSGRAPGRLVLGADQTLSLEGERFTKPASRADGEAQLGRLSGRTHSLFSGVALARDGDCVWSAVEEARLTMRPLTANFVSAYLDAASDAPLASVGGYQFEGLGSHLFSSVDGDFRTVLGLPLLAVLEALRSIGAVMR